MFLKPFISCIINLSRLIRVDEFLQFACSFNYNYYMYHRLGKSFSVDINFRNACVAISFIKINYALETFKSISIFYLQKDCDCKVYKFSDIITISFIASIDRMAIGTVWNSSLQNNQLDKLHGKYMYDKTTQIIKKTLIVLIFMLLAKIITYQGRSAPFIINK